MKASLLMLAPALVAAAPEFSSEKRQLPFFTMGTSGLGKAKPLTVLKTLTPEIDPKATRQVVTWGPWVLTPANATHAKPGLGSGIKLDPNSDALMGMVELPCSDCTVLRAVANIAHKDGTEIGIGDGVYQHHIIMMQFGRTQLMNPVTGAGCGPLGPTAGFAGLLGGGSMGGGMSGMGAPAAHGHMKRQFPQALMNLLPKMAVFVGGGGSVGSGSNFAVPDSVSKVKSGIYIAPKDTMLFTSELINYDNVPKDIYLTLDVEYVPKKEPGLLDIGMGAVGLNCSSWAMQPPKDKAITYPGQDWEMTEHGYFVGFTPHLHDGGVNIKVFLNDKEVCTSTASYGSGDNALQLDNGKKWQTITGYSPCDYMIEFKKGDKMRMSAEYDLTKYSLRPDSENHNEDREGMALATFIWAKANE